MTLELAIQDLADVLGHSRFLDRVRSVKQKPGSSRFAMIIGLGKQTTQEQFGRSRYIQELELTLTIKTKISPEQIAEVLKEIDNDIIADRRRNSQAQTTVLNEEGWTPEEGENGNSTVVIRTLEVHVYEDTV